MGPQVTSQDVEREWARKRTCPWCMTRGRAIRLTVRDNLYECEVKRGGCGCRYKGDDLQHEWDRAEVYLEIKKVEMREVA